MTTVRKLLELLTPPERTRAFLLLPLMLLMALLEVAGIASVMPFLALVADPAHLHENALLIWLQDVSNVRDEGDFLFLVGVLVLVVLVTANAVSALTNWVLLKFASMRDYTISQRLMSAYLQQDYDFFLTRNSAVLSQKLVAEVSQVVHGILIPGLQTLARVVVVVTIAAMLFMIEPVVSLLAAVVLGGVYLAIYGRIKRTLTDIGNASVEANRERFKAASEAMGGIKDVKLLHKERVFLSAYATPTRDFAGYMATHRIMGMLPRYALEVIAFGGILLIVLYLLRVQGDLTQILPLMGVFAFASYRLMPALQNIFSSMTTIRFNLPALDALHQDMTELAGVQEFVGNELDRELLPFTEALELRKVSFCYPRSEIPVLTDIDLMIRPNTSVAFIGATGSGKTTLVDIILGLLSPQAGEMLVDGTVLDSNSIRSWQKNLGYVPQQIYLCDDTVAQNIAFGVSQKQIDMQAVERAAKIACIHEFVVNELPERYETIVGERGIRLSGGQRQRLGIARAVYHDPAVLILDEATSALDSLTEQSVVRALEQASQARTTIIVAHRLTTVKKCDIIYLLDKGSIIACGNYHKLKQTSPLFDRLVRHQAVDATTAHQH